MRLANKTRRINRCTDSSGIEPVESFLQGGVSLPEIRVVDIWSGATVGFVIKAFQRARETLGQRIVTLDERVKLKITLAHDTLSGSQAIV